MMWVAVFAIGLLLALGRQTPVFFLFHKLFPIFRFPEKFVFLCSFALAVLAAEGVEALFAALARTRIHPLLVGGMLAAAMTADLYTHHCNLNPVWDAAIYGRQHPLMAPLEKNQGLFRVYVDSQNLDTPGIRRPSSATMPAGRLSPCPISAW